MKNGRKRKVQAESGCDDEQGGGLAYASGDALVGEWLPLRVCCFAETEPEPPKACLDAAILLRGFVCRACVLRVSARARALEGRMHRRVFLVW